MIKVLAVDDNSTKQEAYKIICSEVGIEAGSITSASSSIDAKRFLSTTQYDVLLLDLALPNRTGAEPTKNGGLDLLHEINALTQLKMPKHIIVISEYDEALEAVKEEAKDNYLQSIRYDATSSEWRERLSSFLVQINRAINETTQNYKYDVAIICALRDPELEEVLKLPFSWVGHNELGDITNYYVSEYQGKKLLCASAYEMGMPAASILATKIVCMYKPRYLVMTGIAAGVDREKLKYGDIMVADPCFDYGSGKKTIENGVPIFKPDYRQVRLNTELAQIFEELKGSTELLRKIKDTCSCDKPDNDLHIRVGSFGSGAAVLADQNVIDSIRLHDRKLLGFDMEAYGVMLSGSLSGTPSTTSVVIKSVSDFGDQLKNDQYQKYAAYTSAKVLQLLIERLK